MRRQEKVAEGLECPINESDIHWKAVGPSATTGGLTQGSGLRPELLPALA